MAAFCTKCGAALTSTAGFCTSCGTPIAAAPVAIPPTAPMQAAPPPAAYGQQYAPTAAGYPPPQKSSSALKIVLIVIAVVVGLGILGGAAMTFIAYRAVKTVSVNADGKGVSVTVPGGGTFTAGDSTASDADLGVPAYPGATREKGGMNMDSGGASMVMAHFSTSDSMSQVVDFYKGKLGDSAVAVSTGEGTVLNSGGSDTDRIMVTIAPGSGDDAGKTTIVIMHTKKK